MIEMPSFDEDPNLPSLFPEEEEPNSPQIEEVVVPTGSIVPAFILDSVPTNTSEEDVTEPTPPFPYASNTYTPPESTPPKRRGRPPKVKSEIDVPDAFSERTSSLRTKGAKDLSDRAQMILVGATSIPAHFVPEVRMTPEEAAGICDPLVSYAKAHVDNKQIEEFVEKWDLIAVAVATANYGVRVTHDVQQRPKQPRVPKLFRPEVVQPVQPVSNPEPIRSQDTSNAGLIESINSSIAVSEPIIGGDGL